MCMTSGSATEENVYHMSCLNIIKLVMLVSLEQVEDGDVHEFLESHRGPVKWEQDRMNEEKSEWTDLEDNPELTLKVPWILWRAIRCYSKMQGGGEEGKAVIRMVFEALLQPSTSSPNQSFFFFFPPFLFVYFSSPTLPTSSSKFVLCRSVSFLPHTNFIAFYIPIWYFWNAR